MARRSAVAASTDLWRWRRQFDAAIWLKSSADGKIDNSGQPNSSCMATIEVEVLAGQGRHPSPARGQPAVVLLFTMHLHTPRAGGAGQDRPRSLSGRHCVSDMCAHGNLISRFRGRR